MILADAFNGIFPFTSRSSGRKFIRYYNTFRSFRWIFVFFLLLYFGHSQTHTQTRKYIIFSLSFSLPHTQTHRSYSSWNTEHTPSMYRVLGAFAFAFTFSDSNKVGNNNNNGYCMIYTYVTRTHIALYTATHCDDIKVCPMHGIA